MFKAIIITTASGEEYWIGEDSLNELFYSFRLPVPEGSQPVISMELRGAVSTYGVTISLTDNDDIRMNMFIPPYQIKTMIFYISKVPPKNQKLSKVLKEIR